VTGVQTCALPIYPDASINDLQSARHLASTFATRRKNQYIIFSNTRCRNLSLSMKSATIHNPPAESRNLSADINRFNDSAEKRSRRNGVRIMSKRRFAGTSSTVPRMNLTEALRHRARALAIIRADGSTYHTSQSGQRANKSSSI